MTTVVRLQGPALAGLASLALLFPTGAAGAQGDTSAADRTLRQATQLDRDGQTTRARRMFQAMIDSASDPAAKVRAQRRMAMSYAFDRNCANTVKYETHGHPLLGDARRALDGDSAMAAQQERYCPYLVGYVALYTNDLGTAEAQLTKAISSAATNGIPSCRASWP